MKRFRLSGPRKAVSALAGTVARSLYSIALGLILLLAAGCSSAVAGNILGDTVTIEYLYPTSSTLYGISTSGVVTASGITLDIFGNNNLTALPNAVELTEVNPAPGGTSFLSAAFNGFSIQDVTNPSAFTSSGFSVDPATTVPAFNISDVSVTGGLLYINYQGLSTPIGSLIEVDFTAGGTTPEPSTLSILALGLGAILAARRRLEGHRG
ncbi:MAG: PEP-CTERM sorting domain-containing protein [Bryobacteraceae bacterium]|jgi:hypothetical protein